MEFEERLLEIMGHKWHPSIDFIHWHGTKKQLEAECQQEYWVYIKDFPRYLENIIAMNPEEDVAEALRENMQEEKYGRISRFNLSHESLFLYTMEGLGYAISGFKDVVPTPSAIKYKQWLDNITKNGSWLEALAVMTLFVEGYVRNEREELEKARKFSGISFSEKMRSIRNTVGSHYLARRFGLNPKYLKFKKAHLEAESNHRKDAWDMVLKYADTKEKQEAVIGAMEKSLKLWKGYRISIAARAYSV